MVKRYTLIDGLLQLSSHPTALEEAALTHARFTGEMQIVLAADYDALAAELANVLEANQLHCGMLSEAGVRERALAAELAENKRVVSELCDDLALRVNEHNRAMSLQARVQALEAALRLIQSMAGNDLDDYFDNVQSITSAALAAPASKGAPHV